jgi:AcrR family transcriptional regulator
MGVMERREREKQELRQQILDTARELFAAEGYEAVTMRKIAEAIEYSPTAIYLYFKDKEELINELCHSDFRKLAKEFQKIAQIPDPVERLKQMGLSYVEFGLAYPNHYRLMFMTSHPNKPTAAMEADKGNPEQDAYAFLRMIVSECIAKGRFRDEYSDVDAVSQVLWAGVHGLVSLQVAKGNDDWVEWRPVRQVAEMMIEVQLRGLLKHEGRS